MTERTWIGIGAADWLDPDNWNPAGAPASGDVLTVEDGWPVVGAGAIASESIFLRGTTTLEITGATFAPGTNGPMRIAVRGGGPDDPAAVTLLAHGTNSFLGQISVEALGGGSLTIAVDTSGGGTGFTLATGGFLLVTQESLLTIGGGPFVNDGLIHIEGRAVVAADATISGTGRFEIDDGGHLVVEGGLGPDQTIVFADGTGDLTITAPDAFLATIALTASGGDRIHFDDAVVQSAVVEAGILKLFAGKGLSGALVAEIPVELVNPADLDPLPSPEQTLKGRDFVFASDGDGGTLMTYAPKGPVELQGSLPVAVVADTGDTVPLDVIFKQAFGTSHPAFYGLELLPSTSPTGSSAFWGQPDVNGIDPVVSGWMVNGHLIAGPHTVKPGDKVEFLVGNSISFPPQIRAQLTPKAKGEKAGFMTYDVWAVDPGVVALAGARPGKPISTDIVNAAFAFQTFYGNVLNTELCNWIADNVAAAAGATMPLPDQYLEPSLNMEGGFWRIAYRASETETPVADWNTLVKPGDIVRLQWASSGTGHTTTVISVDAGGSLTVYDNIDFIGKIETIGVHDAVEYWKKTDPAGITIYRLDEDMQYLTKGTPLGEFLMGSVFDDLVRGKGGGDRIAGSIGADELWGGGGSDSLHGGAGDDQLIGGGAADRLVGGGGRDVFEYLAVTDSTPRARDTIVGFTRGEDRIDLSAVNEAIVGSGGAPLKFVGELPSPRYPSGVGYTAGRNHVLVQADTDGDGRIDMEIKVLGVHKLGPGDFIL